MSLNNDNNECDLTSTEKGDDLVKTNFLTRSLEATSSNTNFLQINDTSYLNAANNDLSCPWFNFEAIDLCLPLNTSASSFYYLNYQQSNNHSQQLSSVFDSPSSLSSTTPATTITTTSNQLTNTNNNDLRFFNQNHNPDCFQRSSSVPVEKLTNTFTFGDLIKSSDFESGKFDEEGAGEEVVVELDFNSDLAEVEKVKREREADEERDKRNIESVLSLNAELDSAVKKASSSAFSLGNSVRSDLNKSLMMKLKNKAKQKVEMINNNRNNENVLPDGFHLEPFLRDKYSLVYTCMHRACGLEFEEKPSLITHLKEKHEVEPTASESISIKIAKLSYKCIHDALGCGKKLETLNKIVDHLCKSHLSQTEIIKSTNSVKPILYGNVQICSHDGCLWAFQSEPALKNHKLKHKHKDSGKNYTCELCNQKFLRPSHLKSHIELHKNPEFKCEYCPQVFIKQSLLLSHIYQNHKSNEKLVKCTYEGCGKTYSCRMYLNSHITKTHMREIKKEELKCSQCDEAFSAIWLRRQHEELKHKMKAREFKCEHAECGKEFSTSSGLQRHGLTHNKIKQFKCTFDGCNSEFQRRDHLKAHLNKHSDNKIVKKNNKDNAAMNKSPVQLKDIDECNVQENANYENDISQTNEANSNSNFFMCKYCDVKFDSDDAQKTHLKSHFDANLASQKLNDYLINSQKRDLNLSVDQILDVEEVNLINRDDDDLGDIENDNDCDENGDNCGEDDDCNEEDDVNEKHDQQANKENNDLEFIYNISNKSNNNFDDDKMIQIENELFTQTCLNDTDFFTQTYTENFENEISTYSISSASLSSARRNFKNEHVININSDDEEYMSCSVILENLSGSARTDYKSNHTYIEKYKSKRKNPDRLLRAKRQKNNMSEENSKSLRATQSLPTLLPAPQRPLFPLI